MPRKPAANRTERPRATKRRPDKRGAGTREEQLERLRALIGPRGEADARKIQESYTPEVIRYAARTDPRNVSVVRDALGVREQQVYEGLKAELGAEEAETWKRLTLAGKRARTRR